MLTDLDATLAQLLIKRMPLDPSQVDISFECPTRAWSARLLRPTVNLYLYDVRENTAFAKKSGQGASPLPPTYFDLSYVITAWAAAVVDEHQLLWRVMMTLMRVTEMPPDVLQGDLQKVGPPVKMATAQWDGVARNPREVWQSLDNVLKPSITYTATLSVMMRPVPAAAPPVLTKTIVTGNVRRAQREQLTAIGGIVRTRAVEGGPPARVVAEAVVTFPQLGISVVSDGDGRYVVARIPAGTYKVTVVTPDGARSEADVVVPAANYNLEV